VCAWGPDCERVHDIVDEERDARNPNGPGVVMTTWHEDESLTEALWFVLAATTPDDVHVDAGGATVGVSIGSSAWADEMRDAFARPSAFVAARVKAE
jgi:hypothetical protein